jgi:hypothetical protein
MASKISGASGTNGSVGNEPDADTITDLGEICEWLGTYRERLREAHDEDRQQLTSRVARWTVRYQQRRSELA